MWSHTKNDTLLLKQFLLSVGGITYNWYRTLHRVVIPIWMVMEQQFLNEQSTFWHNSEFLRNIVANEIGRIDHIPWNHVPYDQK